MAFDAGGNADDVDDAPSGYNLIVESMEIDATNGDVVTTKRLAAWEPNEAALGNLRAASQGRMTSGESDKAILTVLAEAWADGERWLSIPEITAHDEAPAYRTVHRRLKHLARAGGEAVSRPRSGAKGDEFRPRDAGS